MLSAHSFHVSRPCHFPCHFIHLSSRLIASSTFPGAGAPAARLAGRRGEISDGNSTLMNGRPGFPGLPGSVAATAGFFFFSRAWGQEGHLSLAARWRSAKAEEEPHSLQRVTGTEESASTHRRIRTLKQRLVRRCAPRAKCLGRNVPI